MIAQDNWEWEINTKISNASILLKPFKGLLWQLKSPLNKHVCVLPVKEEHFKALIDQLQMETMTTPD